MGGRKEVENTSSSGEHFAGCGERRKKKVWNERVYARGSRHTNLFICVPVLLIGLIGVMMLLSTTICVLWRRLGGQPAQVYNKTCPGTHCCLLLLCTSPPNVPLDNSSTSGRKS